MVVAMVILITGCAGSVGFFRTAGAANALVNPPLPAPLKGTTEHGIRLFISHRASLNIDIEGILDYVQGEPIVQTPSLRDDFNNPWIRCNLAF